MPCVLVTIENAMARLASIENAMARLASIENAMARLASIEKCHGSPKQCPCMLRQIVKVYSSQTVFKALSRSLQKWIQHCASDAEVDHDEASAAEVIRPV
jgi:hypothetical protein